MIIYSILSEQPSHVYNWHSCCNWWQTSSSPTKDTQKLFNVCVFLGGDTELCRIEMHGCITLTQYCCVE